jgi:hypothetical protein
VQWKVNGVVKKQGLVNAVNGVYKIAAGDAGKSLTVTVVGTGQYANPIYTLTASKTSAAKKIAAAALKTVPAKVNKVAKAIASKKPSGKAKVGKKLTAKVGKLPSGFKVTYQWYAGGKKIKKATKKTFKITKKQKGKKITVKVTIKKAGYKTVTKTSKPTAKVKK